MNRTCSAPVVVVGVLASFAAFFAMGAALALWIWNRTLDGRG